MMIIGWAAIGIYRATARASGGAWALAVAEPPGADAGITGAARCTMPRLPGCRFRRAGQSGSSSGHSSWCALAPRKVGATSRPRSPICWMAGDMARLLFISTGSSASLQTNVSMWCSSSYVCIFLLYSGIITFYRKLRSIAFFPPHSIAASFYSDRDDNCNGVRNGGKGRLLRVWPQI